MLPKKQAKQIKIGSLSHYKGSTLLEYDAEGQKSDYILLAAEKNHSSNFKFHVPDGCFCHIIKS